MRPPCLLAAAAILGASLSARADVISTFLVSGIFTNATTVSGNFVIDTTTGTFQSGNLSYLGKAFDATTLVESFSSQSYFAVALSTTNGSYPTYPDFVIGLAGQNLVNYAGGGLCSLSAPCGNTATVYEANASSFLFLQFGSVTPTSPISAVTPEPSSLALLGTGAVGIFGVVRKKFRRA